MSTAAIDESAVADERVEEAVMAEEPVEPAARSSSGRKIFKYSEFLDVGEDAADCAHSRDGQCEDVGHFHAWCRLPNPFQHQDIRSKALAAKARRLRELRDPESDASVVLDDSLANINDPVFMDALIDEMLQREWAEDYLDAQADVNEREEYEQIDQDREEFRRLQETESALPEEQQSPEFKALVAHVDRYVEDINARLKETQEPKREELRSRGIGELVDIVRTKRVEEEGNRAFIETYDAWMWFAGTYKPGLHPTLGRPHVPMWDKIGSRDRAEAGTMFAEAPEVIDALKITFNDLQIALQRGAAGN